MESTRSAAVAGLFYPGDPHTLKKDVAALLESAAQPSRESLPKAIIAPHAGYIYSGPIAASVYALFKSSGSTVSRVVLLGPAHRAWVAGLALPTAQRFMTPLGEVAVDSQAIELIKDLPQIGFSDRAHAQEHSLEVQLPFLQLILKDFKIVPLAVGDAKPEEVAEVVEALWEQEETLFVVSSDLSHYLNYDAAKKIDSATAHAILDMKPLLSHNQACGATPINGFLLSAKRHGLKPQLLDLRNSGDTAGDRLRVVGYAGFAFFAEESHAH
jgi:AmmeMemoRadiSam system protein B